jgi:hypothetical protein
LLAPVPQQVLPQYTVAVPQAPQPGLIGSIAPAPTGTTPENDATLKAGLWFVGGVGLVALAQPAMNFRLAPKKPVASPRTPGSPLALRSVSRAHVSPATWDRVAKRAAVCMTLSKKGDNFESIMEGFKNDFPWLAKYGFGPTVKSERWNGRHAMFGWAAIIATAVCKKYGVFPDPAVALSYKDWGALTQMGFNEYISNERATIMIAHVHALGVSFAAAFGPQVLGDTLTLLDGEEDEEPYGIIIPIRGNYGLTPGAEMINGRLAMLGIVVLVFSSYASGKDIIDIVNLGLDGIVKGPA